MATVTDTGAAATHDRSESQMCSLEAQGQPSHQGLLFLDAEKRGLAEGTASLKPAI